MKVREDGSREKRTLSDFEQAYYRALRAIRGEGYDTRHGNPIVDMGLAFGAMGAASQEDEMETVYDSLQLSRARGSKLDAIGRIIGGGARSEATVSNGTVQLTLSTGLASPSPLFAIGDIYFVDGDGNEYDLTANVVPNSTVTVNASAKSRGTGADKNVAANGITGVRFKNAAVESFWNSNVTAFTNPAAFTGGAYRQSDSDYAAQLEAEDASNRSGSPPGIEQAIRDFAGVRFVKVYENAQPLNAIARGKVFSPATGTLANSELLNAAGGAGVVTKIAQKIVIDTEAKRRFLQQFTLLFDQQSGTQTFRVRIETDNGSGSPSGSLRKTAYDVTGIQPTDNAESSHTFALPDLCGTTAQLPFTIWLVCEITAGTAYARGSTSLGSVGDVKVWKDAAWSNDATLKKLAFTLWDMQPPGSVRAVVLAPASATDLAQVLYANVPAGAYEDGKDTANAEDLEGNAVAQRYETGAEQALTVQVNVEASASFTGDADSIKDVLIEYVGGVDTTGEDHDGLGIGKAFKYRQAMARLFDSARIVGISNVTFLKVALQSGTPLEQDLTPEYNQRFTLAPADITVTGL